MSQVAVEAKPQAKSQAQPQAKHLQASPKAAGEVMQRLSSACARRSVVLQKSLLRKTARNQLNQLRLVEDVQVGADKDKAMRNGLTPLMAACLQGHEEAKSPNNGEFCHALFCTFVPEAFRASCFATQLAASASLIRLHTATGDPYRKTAPCLLCDKAGRARPMREWSCQGDAYARGDSRGKGVCLLEVSSGFVFTSSCGGPDASSFPLMRGLFLRTPCTQTDVANFTHPRMRAFDSTKLHTSC